MTRLVLLLAGTAGLVVVARAASFYAGVDSFAFGLTLAMAGVFSVGLCELVLRARSNARTAASLAKLVRTEDGGRASLDAAPAPLAARLRAHLEQDPMPADVPVIAPFLVGLLVMLGLLGTFLGLFETLRGAQEALEASADVNSLRAGLASPMGGLMRSFGTSAAGVASSAMLGLAMVFVRRSARQLQEAIHAACAGPLKHLSAARRQLSALEELAEQGKAMPAAAEALQSAVILLERLGEDERARGAVLADRIDGLRADWSETHRSSLGELRGALKAAANRTAEAAGAALAPAAAEVIVAVQRSASDQLTAMQEATAAQLEAVQATGAAQLEALQETAGGQLATLQESLRDQLAAIGSAQKDQALELQKVLEAERSGRTEKDAALAERLQAAVSAVASDLEAAARDRRRDESALADRFTEHLQALGEAEGSLAGRFADQLQALTASEEAHVERMGAHLEGLGDRLAEQLERLVAQEDGRAQAASERLDGLVASWRDALGEARVVESARGEEAVERLAGLVDGWRATLESARATEAEHGQRVAQALRSAEDQIRVGAETVAALTRDASEREAARDARADGLLARLDAMGQELAAAREAHAEALAEVEDRLAHRQEKRTEAVVGSLGVHAEKLGAMQATLENHHRERLEAVAEALTSQAERLGTMQQALEDRHAVHAAELGAALVAEAKRLGAGLEETSALVREAAGATAMGGAELAAAAELFTAAVERHGEAAEQWLEGLGQVERAVEEAGESAAVDVLGQYLARTHELFDQQLGFQQALVAQIENQGPLFGPAAGRPERPEGAGVDA